MEKKSLTIAWLYPDLMSTYGDRGNIITLQKRCEWRGIEVKIKEYPVGFEIAELTSSDILFMGGGEDRQQKIVGQDMKGEKALALSQMIKAGVPGLYVCGAYQFLGKYYKEADGTIINGLNILDLYTESPSRETPRLIGNVVAEVTIGENTTKNIIVGFENHGGRTYLGKDIKPLGKILKGFGNNGEDGFEGVLYKNTIGTYFHGPLLPKNPILADFLISSALEHKYNQKISLLPLNDTLEKKAQNMIARRLKVEV